MSMVQRGARLRRPPFYEAERPHEADTAVVVGRLVMVLDPIFQGLAVALISGAVVATGLTMVAVPHRRPFLAPFDEPLLEQELPVLG